MVHHPIQALFIMKELYYTVGMWEKIAMEGVDPNLTGRRQVQNLRVAGEAQYTRPRGASYEIWTKECQSYGTALVPVY
jgi:hypothetical protein